MRYNGDVCNHVEQGAVYRRHVWRDVIRHLSHAGVYQQCLPFADGSDLLFVKQIAHAATDDIPNGSSNSTSSSSSTILLLLLLLVLSSGR